ncbi:MAG: hypothetical protein Q7V88_09490 [Actinomycetota bacterium]|nr:hypothetical protein [Actinomycetota bacterium]
MHASLLRVRGRCLVAALVCTVALPVGPFTAAVSHAAAPQQAGDPSAYLPIGPLLLADTAAGDCGCTQLDAHTIRVQVAGRDDIGADISAAALTVTAGAAAGPGFVSAYPAGQVRPDTSILNLSVTARTSNSAIIPIGIDGAVDLYVSSAAPLTVVVMGTFTPTPIASAGRFVPSAPTRLIDTRDTVAGGLAAGGSVTVPLPAGVDTDARAVVVNVTSAGAPGAGQLTAHPEGGTPPAAWFLTPDGSRTARAASVILGVAPGGFVITTSVGGHVIVDLVGWFTGESASESADGLFVPVAPMRLLDTRSQPSRLWAGGAREVALPVPDAVALVTNVTAVRPDGAGFVTAHPAGTTRPITSSVNAAARDATTPNLAVTTTSTRGTSYFSSRGTDLVVDLTGYFTGTPGAAPLPVPPNTAPVPRVLMIGDSTLGGFVDVPRATTSFRGFAPVLDAKPCRRLVRKSCVSSFTHIAPNTALEAINSAAGTFDIVVIKTGYNDSSTTLAADVATLMSAARAKGARFVMWFTFSESNKPGWYDTHNAILTSLAGSAAYPDLVVANWRAYAAASSGWYSSDRIHLLTTGVYATGDYISRWVASLTRLPCPMPWTVGGALSNPCPTPDAYRVSVGTYPALRSLYGF